MADQVTRLQLDPILDPVRKVSVEPGLLPEQRLAARHADGES